MDLALALQPAGAPDPAAYKAKSGGILDTLEDMLEKAKAEHADAQKAEMNAKFDFDMLKKKLQDLQQECMTKATDYETSQHSRSEELAALQKAKDILQEKTGGAASRAYSFVQVKSEIRTSTKNDQLKDRVLALVQGMADKDGDKMMSLLAERLRSASLMGADPFAKVKGMIQEMIEKLVADAQKEASHKAFCDKEMSETKAKRDDKQSDLDDLHTKIDKATSKIAKLKEEIATLQSELAEIAAAQKKADAWAEAKADYESSVEGVGMALQVLRDYYAEKEEAFVQTTHDKATGAASGIIGMLEVVESDFSKNLAEGSAA